MRSAFVPPGDMTVREPAADETEPISLMKKIRRALFKPGSRRMGIPSHMIMWMNHRDKNKKP